ncbi:tRNA guanosine(34) transglycosylase Tgt [Candidatus Micrarchaeota archaeon]|nr:tRNA guanosine(34) transglycosylase Tgt [Candidatus Micrarchaeota archaeon]
MKPFFEVLRKDGNARAGQLHFMHGTVETPAFAPVATRGAIKLLDMDDLTGMGAQILMANTYHLSLRPGFERIRKFGGLHKFISWDRPIMTDSGGFQAFSLGIGSVLGRSKFEYDDPEQISAMEGYLNKHGRKCRVKITDAGVVFKSVYDGTVHEFTPERSLDIQTALGSDMMFVLDECTYPSADYGYTQESMKRTHEWAVRSLRHSLRIHRGTHRPAIFGIVQGGLYRDLREESARFISTLEIDGRSFDGIGIGGAFGKGQMYDVLDWIVPILPEDKPRHLLGIGTVVDIFESVKRGIDLFDCVGPQRIARAGYFYVSPETGGNPENKFRLRITNAQFSDDPRPLDPSCSCPVCRRYTRAYIHHLFKFEPLAGMRLTTIHNLTFFIRLMETIRKSIIDGRFERLYDKWIKGR